MLLESPYRSDIKRSSKKHVVLLTIDLTRAVASEAIEKRAAAIVSYREFFTLCSHNSLTLIHYRIIPLPASLPHCPDQAANYCFQHRNYILLTDPIIFRGLKSLTSADTQQDSLIRLAQAGISVYSPHTAVDASPGGVNDWLADGISGGRENEVRRNVLVPAAAEFEGAGMGRLVELKEAQNIGSLVERVKGYLGMRNCRFQSWQKMAATGIRKEKLMEHWLMKADSDGCYC